MTNTPLPVQGTVGVNNFPAIQPVSGTVGISGTPNVNVTNTTPLPIKAADNPAFQPYQAEANAFMDSGGTCTATLLGAGSGQRLVIEFVEGLVNSSTTGTKLVSFTIQPTVNGFAVNHFLAPSYVADDGAQQAWQISQAARLYADPNTNVVMGARGQHH